jgi:hypothetical protein
MNLMFRSFYLGLFVVAGVSLAGCGGSQTTASNSSADHHDHETHGDEHKHTHPESFADALTEVDELRAKVETAFAAGDLAKADGPVHEIGRLLEELPELATKEARSAANQQKVKRAVDSLMECFAELDTRVHGRDSAGKSYAEVADQINAALTDLKSVAKEKSP